MLAAVTLRLSIVDYSRRLGVSGFSPGTTGNLSICDRAAGLIAITPSAMRYDEIDARDVVILDLEGRTVEGARRPSTEHGMHLHCYRERPDINAVVHTHSRDATTLAVLGRDLPAVHYLMAYAHADVVRCAPYRLFGTDELARIAVEYLGTGYACLLANHGVLACGPDISHAFALAEQLEFCAGLYLRALAAGVPRVLDAGEVRAVIDQLASYRPQRR